MKKISQKLLALFRRIFRSIQLGVVGIHDRHQLYWAALDVSHSCVLTELLHPPYEWALMTVWPELAMAARQAVPVQRLLLRILP